MKIFIILNSSLGKKGNIGFRAFQIIKNNNINNFIVFSRRNNSQFNVIGKSMGVFGSAGSLLKRIRTFINKKFNDKKYDIYLFELFFFLSGSYKLIKYKKVSLVHLWEFCPNIIQYCKKYQIPIILDIPIDLEYFVRQRGKFFDHYNNDWLLDNQIYCLKNVDHVFSPSLQITKNLKFFIQESKITTNPFGADINVKIKKKFDIKNLKFAFIGELSKRKGADLLIKSWDRYYSNDGSKKLNLFGRTTKSVSKILKKLNLTNIKLFGFVNMENHLKNIDVLILPTWSEGSAKVVYEAAAWGIPIICSKYAGVPESLIKYVLLLDKINEESIFRSIKVISNDVNKLMTMSNGLKKEIKKYSWASYSNRLISSYEKIYTFR